MTVSETRRISAESLLTIKVLEVGKLDALPHAKDESGTADTVEHHPQVTGVQGGDSLSRRLCGVAHAGEGMLNVCPSCNDGAEDHQTEGEESHGCNGATKPEHLTVRDQDDGQVLEDGVDGDREELERPGTCVDHTDEEESNREPCQC